MRAVREAAAALLALVLLAGCTAKEPLPVYYMKVWEDGVDAPLVMDGVRYAADPELASVWSASTSLQRWRFTGETGAAIGVGGDPETGKGSYNIYEVDADRKFLYLRPNSYVIGPYYTFLCIREGTALAPPSAETAGRMVLEVEDEEVLEITDPALAAALFAFYASGEGELLSSNPPEVRTSFTIRIYHRDYPFLYTEYFGTRNDATGQVYLSGPDRVSRMFPAWEIVF